MYLETDRLVLRPFEARDVEAFAAINADPQVMRFFPSVWSLEKTLTMLKVVGEKQDKHGYAFSAIERRDDGVLLGMCGLSRLEVPSPITPCTEIGWRLAAKYWGHGYATEAARAWIDWGFANLDEDQIVSFAPAVNEPSLKVMQRLGMARAREMDFNHPLLEEDSPLRPMSVYRLRRPSPA